MFRRILCLFAVLAFLTGAATAAPAKLRIVTTIFPEYDWVMRILGERAKDAQVTLLLDKGVDLHSFQPSVKDIATIADADLFVFVGGDSDQWACDILKTIPPKQGRAVLNLVETLGHDVKEERQVEGMEHHHHDHAEHDHDHENHDADEKDEHVWLSLRFAVRLCEAIAERLCALDPSHASEYRANCASYVTQLRELDGEYRAAVSSATWKTVLFGDRFPFRYLMDDYGLEYFAAFSGCSAETEASFRTIAFLADKVDELGLPVVLTIENQNGKIAQAIVRTTKSRQARILAMDSLQSSTMRDVRAGKTYLGAMQGNLHALRQALGVK